MKFIFLGSPGVGKGTYASRVKDRFSIPSISTGDMLRTEVKKGTELGIKAREYIDKGEFAPDEIIVKMLMERISQPDCAKGFILDGFPRTIAQAEVLEKSDIKIDAVINFTATKQLIIERLSGRRTCGKCGEIFHIKTIKPEVEGICDKCKGDLIQREDDKPESISVRLDIYLEKTKPLIDFYKEKELLEEVDANSLEIQSIVDNTAAIMQKFAPEEQ